MPDKRIAALYDAVGIVEDRWQTFINTDTLDLDPLSGAIDMLNDALPGRDETIAPSGGRILTEASVQAMFDEALRVTEMSKDPDCEENFRRAASVMASYVLVLAGRVATK